MGSLVARPASASSTGASVIGEASTSGEVASSLIVGGTNGIGVAMTGEAPRSDAASSLITGGPIGIGAAMSGPRNPAGSAASSAPARRGNAAAKAAATTSPVH
jgi:hypothetical protein